MDEMKIEYLTNAAEQRIHRQQEVRFRNKERKNRSRNRNYPYFDMARLEHYDQRMALRQEQRALHLARAWLKGTEYHRVEQTVREGNEPKLEDIIDTLNFFGHTPHPMYVEQWLKAS